MSNSDYKIQKPSYDHIKVGDSILVTEALKEALERYQHADELPNIQNITERMAMAATVVSAFRFASLENK